MGAEIELKITRAFFLWRGVLYFSFYSFLPLVMCWIEALRFVRATRRLFAVVPVRPSLGWPILYQCLRSVPSVVQSAHGDRKHALAPMVPDRPFAVRCVAPPSNRFAAQPPEQWAGRVAPRTKYVRVALMMNDSGAQEARVFFAVHPCLASHAIGRH